MTIKEFALLCGCNPQTIRYYDKINLLKPVRVDEITGYRYYDEKQALDFVKIKNLQEVEFSIEEIKSLLVKNDEDICSAIEKKIEEEIAKLEQMKKIHSTYLSQIKTMETTISEYLKNLSSKFDMEDEFGITKDYADYVLKCATNYFEDAAKSLKIEKEGLSDYDIDDVEEEEEFYNSLDNDDYTVIFEMHNWEKTSEVMAALPKMDDGEYILRFVIDEAKIINVAYTTIVLGMVVNQNSGKKLSLVCNAEATKDETNHFWLLKK